MNALTRGLPITAALGLLAAGCGTDAQPDEPAADQAATTSSPGTPGVETSGLGVQMTELGTILSAADGRSLYLFDPDDQGESTCVDACAASWPPLLTAGGELQLDDALDPDLLGTTTRPDGGTQLTYDGWPLYLWAGDAAAGDTAGQGVNDVWWVLGADGTPIRDAAAEDPVDEAGSDDGSGSGYGGGYGGEDRDEAEDTGGYGGGYGEDAADDGY